MRLKSVGLVCTGMPLAVLGGTFGGGTFGGGTFVGGTFGGEGFAGRGFEAGDKPAVGASFGAGGGGGDAGASFTGTDGGLEGGFGIDGFAGVDGGVRSGGPKRSLGMLPRLGGRSSRLRDIARATEPRGVPFAGAVEPDAEELPCPLPLPATSPRTLASRLWESPLPDTCP